MTVLVPITLFGWIAVAIALFAAMPPRKAVLWAYLLAWLFLPQAGIPLPSFPDLTKITATSLGAMLGVVMFDAGRLAAYRFSWVDLPMAVWCLSSIPTSMLNGLGVYDGLSGVMHDVFTWGIPYLVGRLYFSDLEGLKELAMGVFIGGLIYAPLCALEIRISPQLHKLVYGFHPASFAMAIRFGGYRPTVFMQHGLMLGMWMCSASLVGIWLWHTGAVRRVRNFKMGLLVAGVTLISVMCKSTGAIILLCFGLAALLINKVTRTGVILVLLMSLAPVYMLVRSEGIWNGKELLELSEMISSERATSLNDRLGNEDLLTEKALKKPIFGWGSWGRWRVTDDNGRDITVSDGMWIIVRGEKGLVGLVSVTLVILLPMMLLMKRVPVRDWSQPMYAGPAALAILLMLYSIDNLFNAMLNPMCMVASGGLSGFYVAFPRLQAMARQAQMFAMMQWQQHQARMMMAHQAMTGARQAANAGVQAPGAG